MRKFAIAAVAVLAIAGSTAVYAQHRHWGHGFSRMNPEDRAAFLDARIAAVHAGLKLTADQERMLRDFAKTRGEEVAELSKQGGFFSRMRDAFNGHP